MLAPDRISLVLKAPERGSLDQISPFTLLGAHASIGRGLAVIAGASEGDLQDKLEERDTQLRSSWCLHMLPWRVPTTNWATKCKGIRPVRTLLISQDAFLHAPSADAVFPNADLCGLANQQAVATVLERFVNEDARRFYGRTESLLAELPALATTGVTDRRDNLNLPRQASNHNVN